MTGRPDDPFELIGDDAPTCDDGVCDLPAPAADPGATISHG